MQFKLNCVVNCYGTSYYLPVTVEADSELHALEAAWKEAKRQAMEQGETIVYWVQPEFIGERGEGKVGMAALLMLLADGECPPGEKPCGHGYACYRCWRDYLRQTLDRR